MAASRGNVPVFSGRQMRSPVSRSAESECNAIKSRMLANLGLTLARDFLGSHSADAKQQAFLELVEAPGDCVEHETAELHQALGAL